MQQLYFQTIIWQQIPFTLIANDHALVYISTQKDFQTELTTRYGSVQLAAKATPIISLAITELNNYFKQPSTPFTVPLEPLVATSFQKLVWQGLTTIPVGTTLSYQQLAQQLKRPSSTRAVASAVAKNPFLIMVPCHRVIRNDGQLGQYRSGSTLKAQLLALETSQTNLTWP